MTVSHQSITDHDDGRKYFAQLPHMADDDLDLYEYRLYGHYKRVCGEMGGVCAETERTTYQKCGISRGKFRAARQGLTTKGFIEILQEGTPNQLGQKGKPTAIAIKDLWLQNIQRYSQIKLQKQQGKGSEIDRKGLPENPSEALKGSEIDRKGLPENRKKNKELEERIEEPLALVSAAASEGNPNLQEMITPVTSNQETPTPKSPPRATARPRDEIFDAINTHWNTGTGSVTMNIKKLLTGTFAPSGNAQKDKRDALWIENNLEQPMDAAEIEQFVAWYRLKCPSYDLPGNGAGIHKWVATGRACGYQIETVQDTASDPAYQEWMPRDTTPGPHYEESQRIIKNLAAIFSKKPSEREATSV